MNCSGDSTRARSRTHEKGGCPVVRGFGLKSLRFSQTLGSTQLSLIVCSAARSRVVHIGGRDRRGIDIYINEIVCGGDSTMSRLGMLEDGFRAAVTSFNMMLSGGKAWFCRCIPPSMVILPSICTTP